MDTRGADGRFTRRRKPEPATKLVVRQISHRNKLIDWHLDGRRDRQHAGDDMPAPTHFTPPSPQGRLKFRRLS
jgi:hypothetical protein